MLHTLFCVSDLVGMVEGVLRSCCITVREIVGRPVLFFLCWVGCLVVLVLGSSLVVFFSLVFCVLLCVVVGLGLGLVLFFRMCIPMLFFRLVLLLV